MPAQQKDAIRELTLMLMYLTSWEEHDTPAMRAGTVSPCPPQLERL